ncbi:hypothetical protein MMU07_14635 [Aquiflexum sp. LQ15W]|uniref:hypothetical protein n=1 Tax=Cognataquiflexum nitidum TaxID=2922272 RepID=UPI001F146671|nr:hypothetical protein [Cognataquiflexum nitidum]MCH6200818.1 hypothetical protein [Cognataquiflexum nitidum]
MRISSLFLFLSLFIFSGILSSCIEEDPQVPEATTADIDRVVDKIHEGFFIFSIQGGTKTQAFSIENEGMDGVYGIRMADLENLEDEDLTLFACANALNPGILQKIKINEASNTFAVCRYAVGLSYIAEIEVLLGESEAERLELIQKFEQGFLTASELDKEMDDLRETFAVSYLGIKNFYSEYFRECLHTLVTEISVILNKEQWQIFIKCIDN